MLSEVGAELASPEIEHCSPARSCDPSSLFRLTLTPVVSCLAEWLCIKHVLVGHVSSTTSAFDGPEATILSAVSRPVVLKVFF